MDPSMDIASPQGEYEMRRAFISMGNKNSDTNMATKSFMQTRAWPASTLSSRRTNIALTRKLTRKPPSFGIIPGAIGSREWRETSRGWGGSGEGGAWNGQNLKKMLKLSGITLGHTFLFRNSVPTRHEQYFCINKHKS